MRIITSVVSLAAAAFTTFAQQAPSATTAASPASAAAPRPDLVQIAILLDTSNSMDGLIGQAKNQLWQIVNALAVSPAKGQRPIMQVALYHYGTPSLGAENHFVKQLVPLTDDLDTVSAALFKLTTNGGEEYCGAVIRNAVRELNWSNEKGTFKAIFIAGNEAFSQGPIDYREACKEAISKGIVVNTIFCGNEQQGIQTSWKDGASLADGTYTSIDQASRVTRVASPQDQKLAELGAKLNATYLPYGKSGQVGAANQAAQDANAAAAAGAGDASVAAERAITKAGGAYRNATWDLVDAVAENRVVLKDVPAGELPEEIRALDEKGRSDYLASKLKERESLQVEIKKLAEERDQYLAANAPIAAQAGAARGGGAAGGRGGGGGRGGAGGGGFGGAVIGGAGR